MMLVSKWNKDKIINAYLEAPKNGFNTQLMGKDLLILGKNIIGYFSTKGLEKRDILE